MNFLLRATLHFAAAAMLMSTLFTIDRIVERRRPKAVEMVLGHITPGKFTAALMVAVALALGALGAVVIESGDIGVGAILIVVALPLALFMAPSLTRWHDVRWDMAGVSGPDRVFGLTLGRSVARIAWRDIVTKGKTVTGYDYIESRFGTRIYWSYLYPGHGTFEAALDFYCPQLQQG